MAIRLPDGTVLRNLQEQVLKNKQDIERHYETQRVLEDYGIQIVGSVETVEQLPDPTTYTGSFGDGYTVGPEGGPLTFYIYTRPNEAIGETTNRWLDLGALAIAGPEGPVGPQGEQGIPGESSKWYVDTKVPVGSGYKDGDMVLLVGNVNNLGQVYRYYGNTWKYVGNIRGPQGPIGPEGKTGPRGPQGQQGPQGPRGPAAPIINILEMIDSESQLPNPSAVDPNDAFLINQDGATYLYIIINGVWTNSGRWGGGTSVYEENEFVETFNADTKVSRRTTTSGTYAYCYTRDGDMTTRIDDGSMAAGCIPKYVVKSAASANTPSNDGATIVVGEPTKARHVATKNYVDTKIAAIHEGGFQYHKKIFAVATESAEEPPSYEVYTGICTDPWNQDGYINFKIDTIVGYSYGSYMPMVGSYSLLIELANGVYRDGLGYEISWRVQNDANDYELMSGDGYATLAEYTTDTSGDATFNIRLRITSTGYTEAYMIINQYPPSSAYFM